MVFCTIIVSVAIYHKAIPFLLYERLRERNATRSLLPRSRSVPQGSGTVSFANAELFGILKLIMQGQK